MPNEKTCELTIRAALPKGAAWNPKAGGNYDKTIEGSGEILKEICTEAEKVATVRDPYKTFLLDDLEREFGILKNDILTDDERRSAIAQKKYNSIIQGNPERLQDILQQIDSRLNVYQNSPAVDPTPFIGQGFLIIDAGRGDSAGGAIPADSWPLVFFVGGAVTRAGDGSILTIEEVVLPIEKEKLVTDPIIGFKGSFTWCACVLVVGEKGYIHDAVGNFLVDANVNQIYSLFEWTADDIWVDDNGDNFVDDNGNDFNFYY
jgi:hypothetical protein